MQGNKNYTEALFTNFQLSDHVPDDNFYRRLKVVLDLRFMRKLTAPYYGSCGQKSIDPEVFMKIMLVGYLENILSDRKLMSHCAMRMDILFGLQYRRAAAVALNAEQNKGTPARSGVYRGF